MLLIFVAERLPIVIILLHLFPDIGRPSAVAGEQRMCRLQVKVSGPMQLVVFNVSIDGSDRIYVIDRFDVAYFGRQLFDS